MQRISLRLSILPPMPLRQHFSPLHLQSPQIYLPPTKTESSKRRTNYFSRDAAVRPHLSFPTSTAAEEKRLRYPVKFSDVASSQIPPSISKVSIYSPPALQDIRTNLFSLVITTKRKILMRTQIRKLTSLISPLFRAQTSTSLLPPNFLALLRRSKLHPLSRIRMFTIPLQP